MKTLIVYLAELYMSYPPVAMIKYIKQSKLEKKGFVLAYSPREIESMVVGKEDVPRSRKGLVKGGRSRLITFYSHTGSRDKEKRKWTRL